jgi:hypothetical protein
MGEGGCHSGFLVFSVTKIVSLMLWSMYLLIRCSNEAAIQPQYSRVCLPTIVKLPTLK